MPEQVNLIVLLVGAFVVYYLYQEYGHNLSNLTIKNEGLLNLSPEEEEFADQYASQYASQAPQEQAEAEDYVATHEQKQVNHSQIDNIAADEEYMKNVHQDELHKNNTNVLPNPQQSNNYSPQGNFQPSQQHDFSKLDCFPKDQLVAPDLLPREDSYNVWNASNPPAQGHLSNKNFTESGHHYGLNTQGSTLKNANTQLRSDPHIPMRAVGPWHQSTYEADTNRRALEIGGY